MKPALTKPAARQPRWLLAVQTATACAAFALLAACGGSDNNNNNTPAGGRETASSVVWRQSLRRRHLCAGRSGELRRRAFHDESRPDLDPERGAVLRRHATPPRTPAASASRFRRPAVWVMRKAAHA